MALPRVSLQRAHAVHGRSRPYRLRILSTAPCIRNFSVACSGSVCVLARNYARCVVRLQALAWLRLRLTAGLLKVGQLCIAACVSFAVLASLTCFRGAGPELEALVAKVPALRAILGSVSEPLRLAAAFTPEMPTHNSGVLKESMPGGVRNGATNVVDPLFLDGHLGDPAEQSAAFSDLVKSLGLNSAEHYISALVNVSGCGKTKTALDLLRVRAWYGRAAPGATMWRSRTCRMVVCTQPGAILVAAPLGLLHRG